jgi:hypothetical protein
LDIQKEIDNAVQALSDIEEKYALIPLIKDSNEDLIVAILAFQFTFLFGYTYTVPAISINNS